MSKIYYNTATGIVNIAVDDDAQFPREHYPFETLQTGVDLPGHYQEGVSIFNTTAQLVETPAIVLTADQEMADLRVSLGLTYDQFFIWRTQLSIFGDRVKDRGLAYLDSAYHALHYLFDDSEITTAQKIEIVDLARLGATDVNSVEVFAASLDGLPDQSATPPVALLWVRKPPTIARVGLADFPALLGSTPASVAASPIFYGLFNDDSQTPFFNQFWLTA